VRHRTVRSKGCLSNKTALAMIFKLAEAAEKSWRRLNGALCLLAEVVPIALPPVRRNQRRHILGRQITATDVLAKPDFETVLLRRVPLARVAFRPKVCDHIRPASGKHASRFEVDHLIPRCGGERAFNDVRGAQSLEP
jgi:hypothetical protein